MIAAITPKFLHSISQTLVQANHALNPVAALRIANEANSELITLALLLIVALTGVCVVGDIARVPASVTITSTLRTHEND